MRLSLFMLTICFYNFVFASVNCQQLENLKTEVNVIASNLANVDTTRTPDGGPYQRQIWLCEEGKCKVDLDTSFITRHLPGHIDADKEGNVKFPNINVKEEMIEMISAADQIDEISKVCTKTLVGKNQPTQVEKTSETR